MQQNDDVVSGWLDGSDNVDGLDNPAGPLYVEGSQAMESSVGEADVFASLNPRTTATCSSCSFSGGCCCC